MNLANKITVARILLIPIFIASLFYYKPDEIILRFLPAIIFGIGVVTDALDGFIARVLKQKTLLGTILDPLADKLLLTSAFICLSMVEKLPAFFRLPPWVTIVVVSRDIIIVLGFLVIHHIKESIEIKPTAVGKITTFFQMMTIVALLLQFNYSVLIWHIAVVFTVISGIDYVLIGSRALNGKLARQL